MTGGIFMTYLAMVLLGALVLEIVLWLAVQQPARRKRERAEQDVREKKEELESLFRNNTDALVKYDVDGRVLRGNAGAVRLLGYEPGFLLGKHFGYFVAPEFLRDVDERFIQARNGGASRFQAVVMHADGRKIDVDIKLIPTIVKGTTIGVFSVVRDITKAKANRDALLKSQERIRRLYLVAASAGKTAAEQIQDTLRFGVESLGITEGFVSQVSGGTLTIVYAQTGTQFVPGTQIPLGQTLGRFAFGIKGVVAIEDLSVEPWRSDSVHKTFAWGCYIGTGTEIDGIPYGTVAFHGLKPRTIPWSEDDKEFVQLISALVGSAIERAQRQQELGQRAFYDQLTNLYNRFTLHDSLTQALALAKRRGDFIAVHYIDIDDFKKINDTLGHAYGDEVLMEVAKRLRSTVREIDTVARIGGDEFVILQAEVKDPRDAEMLGNRIVAAFETPFIYENHSTEIRVSVGVALSQGEATDSTALLKRADTALYDAKHQGKNRLSFETQLHV